MAVDHTQRDQRFERFPGRHAAVSVQVENRRLHRAGCAYPDSNLRDPPRTAELLMTLLLRRPQTGQSLIELAISTPLLIFMLFGVFNTAVMISDKVIAGSACRQGARLAAEIGGSPTNPTPA